MGISEDIGIRISAGRARVCPCNHQDEVEQQSSRGGPLLLEVIPLVTIELFGQPEEEVEWIAIGFDAFEQWGTPDQSCARRHVYRLFLTGNAESIGSGMTFCWCYFTLVPCKQVIFGCLPNLMAARVMHAM